MPSESSRLHRLKMGYPGYSTRVRTHLLLAGVGSRRPRPQFCSPGRHYLRRVWLALGTSDFRETAAAPGLHTPCVLAYAKGTYVSEAHLRRTGYLELPFLKNHVMPLASRMIYTAISASPCSFWKTPNFMSWSVLCQSASFLPRSPFSTTNGGFTRR